MEYLNWILTALLAFFLLQRILPSKGVRHITTAELKNVLKDKNIQFVDVRTPGEFAGKHIKEFRNMPLNQLSQKATGLSTDKEVVVICQSGMKSNKAAKQLKKLGFKNIANVKGGMSAWS